jgi:hypothetical protein
LATTCTKHEQQEEPKNNSELQTQMDEDDDEQLHIPAALTPHSAPASTEQTQGGLQSPSGRYGKEKDPYCAWKQTAIS